MKCLFALTVCALLLCAIPAFASTTSPVAVIVTPPEVLLKAGQTQQLHSYAYYQDGTVTDVTNSGSTWSSLNTTIATVSSTGLVTMKKGGSVLIKNKVGIINGYARSSPRSRNLSAFLRAADRPARFNTSSSSSKKTAALTITSAPSPGQTAPLPPNFRRAQPSL